MKDFADIPNSSGTFPSVIAQDCSGPGETDGTALIAETMTDYMGFIQALLSDVGATPDDSVEVYTASQILNALKLIPGEQVIPICSGLPESNVGATPEQAWEFNLSSSTPWLSTQNNGKLYFPINIPLNVEINLQVEVQVVPGAARSGADRVSLGIYSYQLNSLTLIGSVDYDNGGTTLDTLIDTVSGLTPTIDTRCYMAIIKAGNDGATNQDKVAAVKIIKTLV